MKGVQVAIPCSGVGNKTTDGNGIAYFDCRSGSCKESPAYVLGDFGEEQIMVTNGNSYEVSIEQ